MKTSRYIPVAVIAGMLAAGAAVAADKPLASTEVAATCKQHFGTNTAKYDECVRVKGDLNKMSSTKKK